MSNEEFNAAVTSVNNAVDNLNAAIAQANKLGIALRFIEHHSASMGTDEIFLMNVGICKTGERA